MITLKNLLEVLDKNSLCKVIDVNSKAIINHMAVNEIFKKYTQLLDCNIIYCIAVNDSFEIILDFDKRK